MLIKEYFQEIESQIAGNPHVSESHILKDTRSLHIGVIEVKSWENTLSKDL